MILFCVGKIFRFGIRSGCWIRYKALHLRIDKQEWLLHFSPPLYFIFLAEPSRVTCAANPNPACAVGIGFVAVGHASNCSQLCFCCCGVDVKFSAKQTIRCTPTVAYVQKFERVWLCRLAKSNELLTKLDLPEICLPFQPELNVADIISSFQNLRRAGPS